MTVKKRRNELKSFRFEVKGMTCAACVSHVERAAKKVLESEDRITVSLLTNTILVSTSGERTREEIGELLLVALKRAGYTLVTENKREKKENEFRRALIRLIVSAIFCLTLTYLSMGEMIGAPIPVFLENELWMATVQLLLTLPVIVLNFHFFRSGFSALVHFSPNMDSLIATGAGASVIYGCVSTVILIVEKSHSTDHQLYFESCAMILTLVSLGKLLEGRAKEKASDAIRALSKLSPKYACVIKNEKETLVPVEEILVGDVLIIRAGEMIPVDGEVIEGGGSTDESALTGESMPVDKGNGDPVRAACKLCSGYLRIKATGVGENTSLSRIIRLLEDAAASKAPIARIADKVSAVFVPAVILVSIVTFALWMIFTQSVADALQSAIAVLVISCPCALGLATPTAITVGIGRAARGGILFRSAQALERLCGVDTVVFDKTGTVTEGMPFLTDVYTYGMEAEEVLRYAAAVEQLSSHPLAKAIERGSKDFGIDSLPDVENFLSLVGIGAQGVIEGRLCHVGRPEKREAHLEGCSVRPSGETRNGVFFAKRRKENDPQGDIAMLEGDGKTSVVVTLDSVTVGVFGIADRIREDTEIAVEALKTVDIRCLMMTGDNERTAAFVAKKAFMDGYYASLFPEDKERLVKELSEKGGCAMVGDGINDAPALLRADVGIAVGAGTDVAIDCADIVISDFSPNSVAQAYFLSRATMRIVKQNLFWALIYNAVCIPIAAGLFYPLLGWQLSPMLASAAMSLSSVFVVTNALRLRSVKIYGENNTKKKEKEKQQKMKEYKILVGGMMCPRCVAHVKKALEEIEGVKEAQVELATESAIVRCDVGVAEKELQKAIIAAGYEVKG